MAKDTHNNGSLRASMHDGMCHAYTLGAGEAYLPAFGIFLGASPIQVGILAALPPLLGALAQALGVWLMERSSGRRRILVQGATGQALSWLPIGLLALYPGPSAISPNMLILFAILYHVSGNLIAPIWNSLIGDLVPTASRGTFLGYRSRLCNLLTFAGLMLAGTLLHGAEHWNNASTHLPLAYAAVFLSCALMRLTSAYWLTRHEDPSYTISAEHKFSFFSFIAKVRRSNFTKFAFLFASVNGALTVAGPYFAVYLLKELHFTYFQFTLTVAASFLAQVLTLHHWGRLSDQFGNKKILNLCAVGIALNPLLWLISAWPPAMYLAQFLGGCAWAGFTLAASNFMFDAVSPPKRARCAAYVSMVNGIFVVLGAILGALIMSHIPRAPISLTWLAVPDSPYLALFVISAVLRALAGLLFLPLVREVRAVEPIRHRELLFRIVTLRPLSGATFAPFTGKSRRPSGKD